MDDRSSVSTDTSELYSAGQGRLNVLSEAPPIATVIPLDAFKRLHHNNHRGGSPFRMCSRRSVPAVATDASMSQISDFCDSDYMYHSSQESSQVVVAASIANAQALDVDHGPSHHSAVLRAAALLGPDAHPQSLQLLSCVTTSCMYFSFASAPTTMCATFSNRCRATSR